MFLFGHEYNRGGAPFQNCGQKNDIKEIAIRFPPKNSCLTFSPHEYFVWKKRNRFCFAKQRWYFFKLFLEPPGAFFVRNTWLHKQEEDYFPVSSNRVRRLYTSAGARSRRRGASSYFVHTLQQSVQFPYTKQSR